MPFVFGRETNKPHCALAIPAAELKASADPIEQAIGRNLLYDWRVSEERAEHFYDFTGCPPTGMKLLEALKAYTDHWIAVQLPENSYLSAMNQDNFLLHRKTFHLGHVLNLSGTMARISKSPFWTPDEVLEFKDYLTAFAAAPNSPGADYALNRFLAAAHRLNESRPTWAARWTQFKPHIDLQPRSWNSGVGVSRNSTSLQIVFRYPTKRLNLVRPTQLDVGRHAYHFP